MIIPLNKDPSKFKKISILTYVNTIIVGKIILFYKVKVK